MKPQFSTISSYSKSSSPSDNMKVMIRVRPPLPREMEYGVPFRSIAEVNPKDSSIGLIEYLGAEVNELERQRELINSPSLFQVHRFTFDSVFDMDSSQESVYQAAAKSSVSSVLEGYNSTIFAYGQTGTGKTHTMEGFTFNPADSERGIVPRTIEDIFQFIESYSSSNTKFIIRASYLQLYNEYISDLLKQNSKNLQIREDKRKGIYVDMLSEWVVRTPSDIYALLQKGALCRTTASTNMNDVSSRSHAVFVITVEQMASFEDGSSHTKVGKLNLVDLAGSERIRVTGATGKQLEESKKINKSLSALGNVINALTDLKGTNHIPYRDSKLTRLLEDSLGGNCKTTMITMISPSHDYFNESLSSLLFAKRAKNIKNRPVINEDLNQRALISQYEIQLKNLRIELDEKNRLLRSNEHVIQLEEQRKRAEDDKKEVMKALETASKQYIQEREEKHKLEMRIKTMNSQMITGGHKIEDTEQFKTALEERQSQLLKEFDSKLQEFEKENWLLAEDQAETDKYKELLLRQKDIMIALTTKLNERDETIVQLQEDIEVYDKINHQQEALLISRLNRIREIEAICKDKAIALPLDEDTQGSESLIKKHPESRIYLSYEAEKNMNEFDNYPMTMLSSEEKIKELKSIIKEQENEMSILKLVAQKFISRSTSESEGEGEGNDKGINGDFNAYVNRMGNEFELHCKIRELVEEKSELMLNCDKLNEIISALKNENDALYEHNNRLTAELRKDESANKSNREHKKHLFSCIQSIVNSIDNSTLYSMTDVKRELIQLWKVALGGETPHNDNSLIHHPSSSSIKRNNFGYLQSSNSNQLQQASTEHSNKFISKFINAGR